MSSSSAPVQHAGPGRPRKDGAPPVQRSRKSYKIRTRHEREEVVAEYLKNIGAVFGFLPSMNAEDDLVLSLVACNRSGAGARTLAQTRKH